MNNKRYYFIQALLIIGSLFMIFGGLKLFVASLSLLTNLAIVLDPGFTIGILKLIFLFMFNLIGLIFGWAIGACITFIGAVILVQRKEFFK